MMSAINTKVIRFSLALLLTVVVWSEQDLVNAAGPLAIQNAKIITISGDTIESGTIVVRDGVIEAFGEDVKVPGEALVIDGEGKVVMPGFIDAHNAAGMSQANEQNAVVPFLSVVDSIDPIATYFEECRRNGITTASVVPGNSTLIGGKAAIVKTAGQYVDDMLVQRDFALKLSMRPVSGSRMSQMARLRKELDKGKKALEKEDEEGKESDESKDKEEKGKESKDASTEKSSKDGEEKNEEKAGAPSASEEGLNAIKLALQGKLKVYIYCQLAMDVPAAMKIVEEYGLKPIYVLGSECHKAAKMLAEKKQTVILDPTLVYWETDPRTRKDKKIVLPEIYKSADVPFIFQVSSFNSTGTLGSSYFWYQAATAVKYGVEEKDALAALTLEPAKLLGIEESVGSIEVGKEADLIVLTGEPLEISTWVEHTIVGGEIVYDRSEDEKLERLLSPSAE